MSADFGGAGPLAVVTAATTITANLPDTAKAGDVAYFHLQQTDSNQAVPTPSGWTLLLRFQRTTTHVAHVFRKVLAGGFATSVSVTVGVAAEMEAVVSCHRGIDTTTPEDGVAPVAASSTTAAITVTGLNGNTPNSRQLVFCSSDTHFQMGVQRDFLRGALQDDNDARVEQGYGADLTLFPVSVFAYSGPPVTGSMAGTYVDEPLTQIASPASFATPAGNLIAISVVARVVDQTNAPPVGDGNLGGLTFYNQRRPLTSQPPLRSAGVLMAPTGKAFGNPKLVVQLASPYRFDGVEQWVCDECVADDVHCAATAWLDVSALVRGLAWDRGSETPGDRPRVGTAVITLANLTGTLSPWATAGPFTHGSVSWFRPGVLMRFAITTDVAVDGRYWHPLFTGTIDAAPESTSENTDGWVDVNLVETTAGLALDDRSAQAPQGTGENITARLGRNLFDPLHPWAYGYNYAHYTASGRTFQATTLANAALTELYLTADSDDARVFAGSDGAVFLTDHFPTNFTAPHATFANKPTVGQLPIIALKPYATNERILNVARAARAGGTEQEVQDYTSSSHFGRIATGYGLPRDDLVCETDAQALAVLRAIVARCAGDELGIESLEIDCDQAPLDLYRMMTLYASRGIEEARPVAVVWTHPSGNVFNYSGVLAGIKCNIAPEGPQMKWTATLSLANGASLL